MERIVRDANRASEVISGFVHSPKGASRRWYRWTSTMSSARRSFWCSVGAQPWGVAADGTCICTAPVLGDRVQLQQVVINLLINAVEAMAPITDRPREILIRSQQHEAGQVQVAVLDSGIGIDSETAEKLFSAFFTTKPSGMGMGLSISRSIIKAHGGRLWASPNPDHGAAFQFTVPINGSGVS